METPLKKFRSLWDLYCKLLSAEDRIRYDTTRYENILERLVYPYKRGEGAGGA